MCLHKLNTVQLCTKCFISITENKTKKNNAKKKIKKKSERYKTRRRREKIFFRVKKKYFFFISFSVLNKLYRERRATTTSTKKKNKKKSRVCVICVWYKSTKGERSYIFFHYGFLFSVLYFSCVCVVFFSEIKIQKHKQKHP